MKASARLNVFEFLNANWIRWGRIVGVTGASQVLVQLLGFLTGVLIIRALSTDEYAGYTLANSILGIIILLSDGGISGALISLGAKGWNNSRQLGVIIATGLHMRKKFMYVSSIILVPILCFLLWQHGTSWYMMFAINLSLIPLFYASVSDSILEIPLRLNQKIIQLQKNQLFAACSRLLFSVCLILIFPYAFLALSSAGLARMVANVFLRKKAIELADLKVAPDPAIRKEIAKVVKRVLPGSIYFSISGQITIFLVSIFGSTTSIAEVGAISRLAVLLNILNVIFYTLVVPRFARMDEGNTKFLIKRFIQFQAALAALCIFIIGGVYFLSDQFLFILGTHYTHLNTEVMLMAVSSCIALLAGMTYNISLSRGWVLPPVFNILGNLCLQIILILIFDLSNLQNVLIFSIFSSLFSYLLVSCHFIYKCLKQSQEIIKSPR